MFWLRFPQFSSLTIHGANTQEGIYHSLQTKLDKHLSHGLNVIFTYTFSKLIDSNMTSLVNKRRYRSVSEFDRKHVMRTAFVYQMPFRLRGPGASRAVLDQVLGSWRLSGHASLITGSPLSVSHASGRLIRLRAPALKGSAKDRLGDKAGSRRCSTASEDRCLFFSNLQLFKAFPIREMVKLEFSFQAGNALNSPQWGDPGTNMSNLATFGVINSSTGWRTVMTSLRVRF